MEKYLTPMDICNETGWSKPTVLQIFARPDFPCLDFGRAMIVKREAWEEWASKRHTKNDFKE